VPSLTVKLPRVKNPRPSSEVPDVSGTVPVPVAGAAKVTVELEDADELEDEDDAVEALDADELLDEGLSALCTAAVSAVLTRVKAVWLAMLDRPVDSVVVAPNIWVMTAELSACDWVLCCALAQKFWSCCQNETLPTLVIELSAANQTPLFMAPMQLMPGIQADEIHLGLTILADLAGTISRFRLT
jgi:hypothetical protein